MAEKVHIIMLHNNRNTLKNQAIQNRSVSYIQNIGTFCKGIIIKGVIATDTYN